MGERAVTLKLEEAGGTLKGTVESDQGNAPVEGTQSGDTVEFKGSVTGPMGAIELTFTGTQNGDEMSGNVKLGTFGDAPWTATRA
jgi:hypothetical protein